MDVDNLSGDDFSARNDAVATGHPCVTDAVRACCAAALRNRVCSDSLSQTVDERRIVGAWTSRYDALIERAKRLALAGEARGGLAFDELKKQSMALADEVLPKQQRGDVFVRVAQTFDKVAAGEAKPSKGVPKAKPSKAAPKAKRSSAPKIKVWQPYEGVDDASVRLLQKVQMYSGWGADGRAEFESAKREYEKLCPSRRDLVQVAISNGQLFTRIKQRAFGYGFDPNGKKKLGELIASLQIPEKIHSGIWKSFSAGQAAKARQGEVRQIRAETSVPVRSDGIHPNSILTLHPSKKWMIVSDETGSEFGNGAFASSKSAKKVTDGRYVFVLIPETTKLALLPRGWHACKRPAQEALTAAENLRNSGCGVLGVAVRDMNPSNRDLWFSCIETLLDLTLRLLPIEGETTIELHVEQRGARTQSLLDKTVDDVMHHLAMAAPDRARLIRIVARIGAKSECEWNGYADLAAYSWGCGRLMRREFARFGWEGPCFVSAEADVAQTFRRCLELVRYGKMLSVADWESLVTERNAQAAGSLVGALLRAFGDEARQNVDLWRTYLDYTVAHLDSKAIRLSVLGKQIAWLKEYEPDAATLPPRLRLLWLTAQLAASNHTGGTRFGVAEHEREFADLTQTLKDEDAPLTCFAALHLAVEKTDRFEFEAARAMLLPWLDEPVAVPGLRYHGQILSSLGQHEAFLGNNEKALDYFDRAIAAFKRLSEHSQSEIDHTLAYAVIAAMDAKSPRLNELLATYLYGGAYAVETMVDKANQFASVGEDEPDSKYAHAIFLRHLVTLPTDDPIRAAYLAHAADWKWSTDGHPWELIAFYRAILLGSTHADSRLWLRRGYDLAKSGGPTLKLIACVIAAGLVDDNGVASNEIPPAEYQSLLDKVAESLPALGEPRLAALRDVNSDLMMQLSLAMRVLPFNFR